MVPRMVARMVANGATMKLLRVARAHSADEKRLSYHCSDQPGMGAGGLLVFILSIGYYVTPALLGGADDQMLSYYIAQYTNVTVNWGMACALGAVLLSATLVLYAVYRRVVKSELSLG